MVRNREYTTGKDSLLSDSTHIQNWLVRLVEQNSTLSCIATLGYTFACRLISLRALIHTAAVARQWAFAT